MITTRFRRWLATQAEEAGLRENVVAAVMGHRERFVIGFGLSSNAELVTLTRDCVAAVNVPTSIPPTARWSTA